MSRTSLRIGGVAVLEAVVLALTIRAHVQFHPAGGLAGTSVMTLGQAMGWLVSFVLLIILVIMIVSAVRKRRERPRIGTRSITDLRGRPRRR